MIEILYYRSKRIDIRMHMKFKVSAWVEVHQNDAEEKKVTFGMHDGDNVMWRVM